MCGRKKYSSKLLREKRDTFILQQNDNKITSLHSCQAGDAYRFYRRLTAVLCACVFSEKTNIIFCDITDLTHGNASKDAMRLDLLSYLISGEWLSMITVTTLNEGGNVDSQWMVLQTLLDPLYR